MNDQKPNAGHVYIVLSRLGARQCVLMFGGGAKDYTEKMLECWRLRGCGNEGVCLKQTNY